MLFNFLNTLNKPKGRKAPIFQTAPRDNMTLWYCFPASESYIGWEQEALPIGNGDMGNKIFGGVEREHIQFNEMSLWSGSTLGIDGCDNGNEKGDQGKSIKEVQQLLFNGEYDEATQKMQNLQGDEIGLGAYQNFGDMYFDFKNFDGKKARSYIRDLDLKTAVSSVEFIVNGNRHRREFFANNPSKVSCYRFTGNAMEMTASVEIARDAKVLAENDTITASGEIPNGDNPLKFFAMFKLKTDGEITTGVSTITITNASYIEVISSYKTNYGFEYPLYRSDIDCEKVVTETVNKATEKGYEILKSEHIADYNQIFGRVKLNLNAETPYVPTDVLLYNYKKNKPSLALEALCFNYGRYLLISSSRGQLPANLQGVWNAINDPKWQSDYHLNINLQMNYWPALVTNMKETMPALINYVNKCLVIPGRATASKWFGIGDGDVSKPTGWMATTQNNLYGHTGPGSCWQWGWAPTTGAFILENTYDYYTFTKDIETFAESIFPAMQECALIWSQILIEDKKTNRLVSSPCFSPEQGPVGMGTTFDQELVWQLYSNVINGAKDLIDGGYESKVDKELLSTITSQIERLQSVQVGKWGQIKEWVEEDQWENRFKGHNLERNHRHLSHLLGLYPGNHITTDTPEWFKAAEVSLLDRGDSSQGWSLAQRACSWARLGNGDRSYRAYSRLVRGSMHWNLWSFHPPFQIDGNFGSTSAVAEMLIQSHATKIVLLPALPKEWAKKGSFTGLIARGNFEISCQWENGKVTCATVKSLSGGKATICFNEKETQLDTEKSQEYQLEV